MLMLWRKNLKNNVMTKKEIRKNTSTPATFTTVQRERENSCCIKCNNCSEIPDSSRNNLCKNYTGCQRRRVQCAKNAHCTLKNNIKLFVTEPVPFWNRFGREVAVICKKCILLFGANKAGV